MAQNYGLGRGLASLIPQKKQVPSDGVGNKPISEPKDDFNYFGASSAPGGANAKPTSPQPISIKSNEGGVLQVDITQIIPNPHQPRHRFDELKLKELAASIKEHGIIQPLTVSKNNGNYEIIAGERRFEAAKISGLQKVPVIVRDATEQQKLEIAVIENIQRHDLNPVEEARAFQKLVEEFDISQEEIALKLGKSRSSVANKLRLLNLPVEIQKAIIEEKITEGHAKAILAIDNPEKQRALFDLILKNNLTVRQTENKTKEVTVRTHKRNVVIDPVVKQIEDDLSGTLGTKVKLQKSGGGGKIVIEYYSQEELDNILSKIK
ncbi:MAG: ParB/RepB/Spo0J family partition protein [Parcubacteria group bacterium]|jgi:ParB family chromosome partitioning protein